MFIQKKGREDLLFSAAFQWKWNLRAKNEKIKNPHFQICKICKIGKQHNTGYTSWQIHLILPKLGLCILHTCAHTHTHTHSNRQIKECTKNAPNKKEAQAYSHDVFEFWNTYEEKENQLKAAWVESCTP